MLIWAYPILWQGDFCDRVWNGFVDINRCTYLNLWVEQGNFSKLAARWLAGWMMD